ncbi:Lactoylglutathione lyase [Zea mays]|uniref:Lactoylglutathione lyase n=2 Tax=Zea mays TaxID=4577 RepID=A0A3L6FVW0_MAIZE|nr:Lactoylglutathione lyase [Zea mays]
MATDSEASKAAEVVVDWHKQDKKRMLHAVYRVGDLDRTIKYYTECFGMKLLRKRDVPDEKYTNAFLGFGPENTNFAVELTNFAEVSRPTLATIKQTMYGLIIAVAQCEDLKLKCYEEMDKRKKLYNIVQETKGFFCRCRPLSKNEVSSSLNANGGTTKKTFKFDRVFTPKDDQGNLAELIFNVKYSV